MYKYLIYASFFLLSFSLKAQDTLKYSVHFELDAYRPNQNELSDFQKWLSQLPERSIRFILSGHTDLRASNAYNQKLAENRAKSVEDLILSSMLKVEITTSSYGEEKPLLSSETEEAFAQNRRVEVLVILSEIEKTSKDSIQGLYKFLAGFVPHEKVVFTNNSWQETKAGHLFQVQAAQSSYPISLDLCFTQKISEMLMMNLSTTSNGLPIGSYGMGSFNFDKADEVEELFGIIAQSSGDDPVELFYENHLPGERLHELNWKQANTDTLALNVSGQEILNFIQSGMWGAGNSTQNPCATMFFIKRWFSKGCGFRWKKNSKQTVNIITPNRVYSQEQLQEIFKGKDLNGLAEKIDPNELYMIYNISWRQEYHFINYDYFVKFNKALLDLKIPGEVDASYDAKLVFAKEKLIYPAYLIPSGFLFKNVPEGETAKLIIIRYQNEVISLAEELIVFDKRTFPLNEMKFTEYPEVNAFRDKLRELDI